MSDSLWIEKSCKDKFYYKQKGLHLSFSKEADKEVRRACIEFCQWLRKYFYFPIRINIYFKDSEYILSKNREKVSATFFGPDNKQIKPYIRIAIGDYNKLLIRRGKSNALVAILGSIIHELTHYFQWLDEDYQNDFINAFCEREAKEWVHYLISEYSKTRNEP